MESFDYCEALGNCDAEFQKRKRRIFEVEDSIEGLRITVEEIEKENLLHQKQRKLQETEENFCQSNFDAAIARKFKINAEIDQYEIEVANLTQQISHIKTQMDEAKSFMHYQLNNSKKCGDKFADQYMKYPWISNYENAKKHHENITSLISENQSKISSLEKELSRICSQKEEKYKLMVGSCVGNSLLLSKINSATKQMKENTEWSFRRTGSCKEILQGMPELPERGIYSKLRTFHSENKTLSQSIISQRTSPPTSTIYKSLPLRERQLSSLSLPTLPLKKLSSTSRLRSINGKSLVENTTFLKRRN